MRNSWSIGSWIKELEEYDFFYLFPPKVFGALSMLAGGLCFSGGRCSYLLNFVASMEAPELGIFGFSGKEIL